MMPIDFSPIHKREAKIMAWGAGFDLPTLREAANASIDFMLDLIADLNDADVTFIPHDPEANDPYAPAELQNVGWSIAHLILHVTASTEEYASISSILARGIDFPAEMRLRYEPDWQTTTQTVDECRARLLESKRMRNAFLESWPDQPHTTSRWQRSERFVEIFGEMDYKSAFLMGLSHEYGHHAQLQEAKRQALEARQTA
jgi:hypothetical protein